MGASPRAAGISTHREREKFEDAAGKWLMPGLLDIHTHMDLEVELDAGLSEPGERT
ncbi:MAG: hypothetical protein O7G83_13455 [Proteobacteria bacterium]|nr:hypothetical protein [Pseudomonadota bacterium]